MENTATNSRVNQRWLLSDLVIWRTPSPAAFTRAFPTLSPRGGIPQNRNKKLGGIINEYSRKKEATGPPIGPRRHTCRSLYPSHRSRNATGRMEREEENKPAGNSRVGITAVPNRVQRRAWRGTVCCIKVVQQFVAREVRPVP